MSFKRVILLISTISSSIATEDCAVEWDSKDGQTYTSSSLVCWKVNNMPYNYHCWDQRTCQKAEFDPSNPNSGWSQNGQCAQRACKRRPTCVENGKTCASNEECCTDSVCRSTTCSNYFVTDNMIRYKNFRLEATPLTEIFEIRRNTTVA
jgi:hypothetical protein